MNKIIRNKDNGYSVINNHCLRNKNISEKAKGVFSIIMSLPDNWDFSINGLITICNGGESAIRSAIKELIENGYCQRNVIKHPTTKRIIDWEYTFSEKPLCDFPQVEEPQMENPHLENHTQLNKDESIPDRNKKRTKKEQFFFDFESDLISIFSERPLIEDSICEWIDYKFDTLKESYKTVRWIKGILEYSDNQINNSISKAMEKEWKGFFPESEKDVFINRKKKSTGQLWVKVRLGGTVQDFIKSNYEVAVRENKLNCNNPEIIKEYYK